MRPAIYLAGKISKNDWRHALVSTLRGRLWSDGPIDCQAFSYVGPFFVSCDHGCNHGPNLHGAVNTSGGNKDCGEPFTRKDVIANNLESLANANLVFAYITHPDCYGTMGEIGWAIAKGKAVVICFAPEVDHCDFWFWSMQAQATHTSVRPCCLPAILQEAVLTFATSGCDASRGVSTP